MNMDNNDIFLDASFRHLLIPDHMQSEIHLESLGEEQMQCAHWHDDIAVTFWYLEQQTVDFLFPIINHFLLHSGVSAQILRISNFSPDEQRNVQVRPVLVRQYTTNKDGVDINPWYEVRYLCTVRREPACDIFLVPSPNRSFEMAKCMRYIIPQDRWYTWSPEFAIAQQRILGRLVRPLCPHQVDVLIWSLKLERELFNRVHVDGEFRGGLLIDPVGTGKTACVAALIASDERMPLRESESGISLVICPNRLVKQWKEEITLTVGDNLHVFTVQTIRDVRKLSLNQERLLREIDVIILSSSVLTGKLYVNNAEFKFSRYRWRRIIVDEAHNSVLNSKYNLSDRRRSDAIHDIFGNSKWIVSATPFIHHRFMVSLMAFMCSNRTSTLDYLSNPETAERLLSILRKYTRSHSKGDIVEASRVPCPEMENVFLEPTPLEFAMYRAAENSGNPNHMAQAATGMAISEYMRNVTHSGSEEAFVSNEEIQQRMIEHYTQKIGTLDSRIALSRDKIERSRGWLERRVNIAEDMVQHHEDRIAHNEQQIVTMQEQRRVADNMVHIFTDLPSFITQHQNDSCAICLETFREAMLTVCGHLFCVPCMNRLQRDSPVRCPMCRHELPETNMERICMELPQENNADTCERHEFAERYGSKISYTVQRIQEILDGNSDNRVIVFSQWKSMLHRIASAFQDVGIIHAEMKGNSFVLQAKMEKFKRSDDMRVLLMCAERGVSGINLIQGTHIILTDLLHTDMSSARQIEAQAIGRCVRMGQRQRVKVIRVLMRGTLEEAFYNSNKAELMGEQMQQNATDIIEE